jgi:CBS domain-containing protein
MKCIKAIVEGRETVTVAPTVSVADASRVMAGHDIGAVPVVDGDRLAGIFTERDILARVVAANLDCSTTAVGDVMSTGLIVADLNETYDACLQRMKQARVRHLIVLDRGRLAGILSLRDLLAMDLDDKDEAIALLNAYVHYVPADVQPKAGV